MSSSAQREEEIFAGVVQLPAERRGAYLDKACADDPALRRRIEALLGALDRASPLLREPPQATPARSLSSPAPAEKPGDRIGHYKLLEQIGEGGCGVVYVAEQEEPVRRRVALKVIKLGMDTRQVIARFEAERQALALMDHPNIAKIHDAGVTETGRPYFVMELVRGIKITDYCDQNHLPPRERLDLFIQVCRAIQHAHQKGIIHRDIKPSNILVTVNDDVAVPKVIDFGIAKATQGRLTDQTVYTAFEQFIGTPAYMSPEQAVMTSLDIDTRSDIYSLGVLLYELLTGTTPFDAKKLLAKGLDEMRRTIREVEPVKPSTRLTQDLVAADVSPLKSSESSDGKVRADSRRLLLEVRGDLDWIVMKCLEKDRTRRYETANGLATDISRHLNNEPVVARPPSKVYEFQKTVLRHKFGFAAAGAVTAALIAGLAVSTGLLLKEREARRLAVAAQKTAQTEAAKATAISDFLQQALSSANPNSLKGSQYTVRNMLDDFSAGLTNQFQGQPEVEAEVRVTLGRAYFTLDLDDKSQAQLERAVMLWRHIAGADDRLAATLVDCAWTSYAQGRHSEGEAQAREALGIYRKRGTIGQPVITALWALEKTLSFQGRFADAEAATAEASAIARKSPGVEFPELAGMINGLAEVRIEQSRYAEAEALATQAVATDRRLRSAGDIETGWALLTLGRALRGEHKFDEAEGVLRETLGIFRKQYTLGNVSMDMTMAELKAVLEAKGNFAGLEALYEDLLAEQRKVLGNDSLAVAETLLNLSDAFQAQGKQADAERASGEARAITLKLEGPNLRKLPALMLRQAQALRDHGKSSDAEKLFEKVINLARPKLGETNLILGELFHDYAEFWEQENKYAEAAEFRLNSLPIRRTRPDDNLAWTLRNLGGDLVQLGRSREAETYLRESVALYRQLHPEEEINGTAWPTERLAYALWQQHRLPEAEHAYRDALVACTKCRAEDSGLYVDVLRSLMGVLKEENKLAEGEALCREILVQQRAAFTNDNPAVAQTLSSLADNLAAQGKSTDAEQVLRDALSIRRRAIEQEPGRSDYRMNLGHLQWRLSELLAAAGQSDQAVQALRDASPVFEQAVHDFSTEPFPRQEEAYNSWLLAGLLERTGRLEAAQDEYRKTIVLLQKASAAFPNEMIFRSRLADVLLRLGKPAEVKTLQRESLQDLRKRLPADDPELAGALAVLALSLLSEHKFAEAETNARECLAIREKRIPDEWLAFHARSMLGGALLGQKKYPEAEPFLLSGYEGMKQREDKIPPEGKARLPEAIQRLVQLYEEMSQPEKAADWKKKLPAPNETEK